MTWIQGNGGNVVVEQDKNVSYPVLLEDLFYKE